MPQHVIERHIPGVGERSADYLRSISQKSCSVLDLMGPEIQWQQSYVTGDRIYCVYEAPNEAMIRKHARQGGFPVNRISEVAHIIGPGTTGA